MVDLQARKSSCLPVIAEHHVNFFLGMLEYRCTMALGNLQVVIR